MSKDKISTFLNKYAYDKQKKKKMIGKIDRYHHVRTGEEYYVLKSVRRAWANGTYQPSLLRTFDWQGAGFRDEAISQNHNFSIRGGTKETKVFLSVLWSVLIFLLCSTCN